MIDNKELAEFIVQKTKKNAAKFGDKLPHYTVQGKYQFEENGFWTGGFWTGILYKCFLLSKDTQFLDYAKKSRFRFANRLNKDMGSLGHDVGFFYSLSTVADYKLTGSEESKALSLKAADFLAARFHEKGNYIQAWDVWQKGDPFSEENRGRVIIDCMYNLPILYFASETTKDMKYKQIAIKHGDTCSKTIVRADYTTFHTYVFNPETGESLYGRTFQGYADNSCWARGQAWAIGGFAHSFRYTKNKEYLDIAKACSKVFIDNLEDDFIPMWDFSLPKKEGEPRDTSAASCAAAGFLEISRHVQGEEKQYYFDMAVKIIDSLFNNYSTKDMPEDEGLLLHACNHKPHNSGVDCSNIYGDYYFSEAVAGILGQDISFW